MILFPMAKINQNGQGSQNQYEFFINIQIKKMEGKKNIILARAVIPIFYSTVTNTSKKIAYMLQDALQKQNFIVTVTNIGDIDHDQFQEITGPIVLIMSTYGNGGSPADGQQFVGWLKQLQTNNLFQHLQFSLMGLGNRTFQHFCGNSKIIRQILLKNGAKQICQFVTCNSASQDQTAVVKFSSWSQSLIQGLKKKYDIKQINVQDLHQSTRAIISEQEVKQNDWQNNKEQWQKKLGKQFLAFHKSFKAQVIYFQQMRKANDGRSTLWIRLKIPQGLNLQPACNINVYPENVRKPEQTKFKGSVKIESKKNNGKVQYPQLPYERLWQISNINQFCDINTLNYGLTISSAPKQIKQKYHNLTKNVQQYEKNPVRCFQPYKQLNLGPDFLVKLGINTLRPYTLASWSPENGYFDLIVSISPLGLTSRYFQSKPSQIRVNLSTSSFYAPSGRPIIMIANGTGIAPFRSLVEYLIKNEKQLPNIYLYFGIQSKEVDYYFGEEWETLQKQGKIKLRIAESRANHQKKVYVQDLIKQDRAMISKHLFQDKGVIFICGGASMAKGVDTQLFEAIKLKHPIPFKAFKASKELQNNKTIVKQVYH